MDAEPRRAAAIPAVRRHLGSRNRLARRRSCGAAARCQACGAGQLISARPRRLGVAEGTSDIVARDNSLPTTNRQGSAVAAAGDGADRDDARRAHRLRRRRDRLAGLPGSLGWPACCSGFPGGLDRTPGLGHPPSPEDRANAPSFGAIFWHELGGGSSPQGRRPSSALCGLDFHQELVAPSGDFALAFDGVSRGMALE